MSRAGQQRYTPARARRYDVEVPVGVEVRYGQGWRQVNGSVRHRRCKTASPSAQEYRDFAGLQPHRDVEEAILIEIPSHQRPGRRPSQRQRGFGKGQRGAAHHPT